MTATPVIVSWSGGKDSTLALEAVRRDPAFQVVGLLTTITADFDRISMHGVRTELLRAQARALGMPLFEVRIPHACSNEIYEAAFEAELVNLRQQGVNDVVFGDLFLEDIRAYREAQLGKVGMKAHFPIWEMDTSDLAQDFVKRGFRAVLVCVDPRQIAPEFCGRDFDAELLADLPASCDPCGERGEFHSFVYDGPEFQTAIPIVRGNIVERDGFVFSDLVLNTNDVASALQ